MKTGLKQLKNVLHYENNINYNLIQLMYLAELLCKPIHPSGFVSLKIIRIFVWYIEMFSV